MNECRFAFIRQMATAEKPDQQAAALVLCKYCSRTFTADALGRHEPACMKGALKKRRQFDSLRQRMEGYDPLSVLRILLRLSTDSGGQTSNWGAVASLGPIPP